MNYNIRYLTTIVKIIWLHNSIDSFYMYSKYQVKLLMLVETPKKKKLFYPKYYRLLLIY